MFVEANGAAHPLEIKLSANPGRRETRKFEVLERAGINRGPGVVVCMVPAPFPIDSSENCIPGNVI